MSRMRISLAIALLVSCGAAAAAQAGEDFSGQDLVGRDFTGKRFEEANFEDAVLKEARLEKAILTKAVLKGADLSHANLTSVDATEADFRGARLYYPSLSQATFNKANFQDCDLSMTNISHAKFREANLRNLKGIATILDCDFYKADLRGANLVGMSDTTGRSNFRKAKYDKKTRWPKDFDIAASGAELVETEDAPSPIDLAKQLSKEFAKLDANEDGRLTGSEAKGLEDYDADKNGKITFDEFVEGKTKKE